MSTVPGSRGYAAYMAVCVGAFMALPLWRELREPGQPVWNTFLAGFLVAILAATFFGIRHLQKGKVEVGEARFTSPDADA